MLAHTTVTAPFRVIDPTTGRTILEIDGNAHGGILRLFHANGSPAAEIAADEQGTATLSLHTAAGLMAVTLDAYTTGGTVACWGREPSAGAVAELRACVDEGELQLGGVRRPERVWSTSR